MTGVGIGLLIIFTCIYVGIFISNIIRQVNDPDVWWWFLFRQSMFAGIYIGVNLIIIYTCLII